LALMIPSFVWGRPNINSEFKPQARRYHSAVVHNDEMYVFGGCTGDQKPNNDCYKLNIRDLKWIPVEVTGDVPCPRHGHVAVLHQNKMYVHGGNIAKYTSLGDFFVFDLDSNIWSQLEIPNGPPPRYGHSGFVFNDKLFIFGGAKTNKIYYNDLWTYDFESKTWTLINLDPESLPLPRAGHASFVINKQFFIYGGYGEDGGYTHWQDMFSISLDNPVRWHLHELSPSSTLPCTGRQLSAVVMDSKAYIFGGYDGKLPQGSLYCFNPNYHLWSVVPLSFVISEETTNIQFASSKWHEPIPRYGHSSIVHDRIITIFGGSGSLFLSEVMQIDYY